jgi:hypothetical protein
MASYHQLVKAQSGRASYLSPNRLRSFQILSMQSVPPIDLIDLPTIFLSRDEDYLRREAILYMISNRYHRAEMRVPFLCQLLMMEIE